MSEKAGERARPLILVILDGFGVSRERQGNPVAEANAPVLRDLERHYPFAVLQASGPAVGLPWGVAGNSEVGHLTMGGGRVMYHHLSRIADAIRDRSFFENAALRNAAAHVAVRNGRLHLVGLVSSGSVHSHREHLTALLEFARREGVSETYIHIFTDGKDASAKEGASFLAALEDRMRSDFPQAAFASVVGRFFAMDRDGQWDRVQRAYKLMTQGSGERIPSVPEYLVSSYERGITDEFMEPAIVTGGERSPVVRAGDAVVFFNFREDSMREITAAFADDDFHGFVREKIPDVFVATMSEYRKGAAGIAVMFPALPAAHTLGRVIADAGLTQLRVAESEKYAHVTYFFNGGEEEPFSGEERVLVASIPVAHFDATPQMQSEEITARILAGIGRYDVMIANFANADLVGHSGKFRSAVAAVEALDEALGVIMNAVLNQGGVLVITADHGNVEMKRNLISGEEISEHSLSPVPFFIAGKGFRRAAPRTDEEIARIKSEPGGILTDVAPTVLELLGLEKPPEMTGQSLLPILIK